MNNMLLALQITALGMGLVFAAILILWGLMSLLTFITAEREQAPAGERRPSGAAETAGILEKDLRAQAAAVAVATALAQQKTSSAHPLELPPTAIVSAWQLGMRTRQMYQKGIPVRRQPR
jgi:Na+-transporting methylmalonyl-CoA/oxaloacetate decarboxylase gamma subunit